MSFGPDGQGHIRQWPRYTSSRGAKAIEALWYTERYTVLPGRTTAGIAPVYRKHTGGTPPQAVPASDESPFSPHCFVSQAIRLPDGRLQPSRFCRKRRFRYTLGLPLSGRDLSVTFSVGAVERPKSAETREESGPKGGCGAGTEVGAREAVHRYQGGRTRPLPTRAALRLWRCGFKAARDSPARDHGGGGGNRTHVRWTVLARPYEHSLRFIFARRKPAGGPLARRSGSPSRPFAPTMSNTVAASQKRPTPDTHRREPSPEMTVLPQSWQRRALPGCRDSRSRRVSGGVGVVPNRGG